MTSSVNEITLRDTVILTLSCGLLASGGEIVVLVVRMLTSNYPGGEYSREVVWMGPLASVTGFAVVASVLLLLSRLWKKGAFQIVVGGLFALTFYAIGTVTVRGLYPLALVVLALGAATQLVRLVVPRRTRVLRGATILVALLGVIVGVSTVGLHGGSMVREWMVVRGKPVAREGSPNVLLLILDTVRAQNLGLYGHERATTPTLDSLSATAMVFDRAVAPAPWTLPSHASMFTGEIHHDMTEDWWTPLSGTFPTLSEVLGNHGYRTAGFVANLYFGYEHFGLNRGFDRYEDHPISLPMLLESAWITRTPVQWMRARLGHHAKFVRKTAADVNQSFFDWLPSTDRRPFFAFLNYIDAHDPYRPPEPFTSTFGSTEGRYWLRDTSDEYLEGEASEMEGAYDGAIRYLDEQVGHLFEGLRQRGLLEHTLVIVASDHGEEFGEHGVMGHSYTLYSSAIRVPLLIWLPRTDVAPRRIAATVGLRDLPATVIDVLQLTEAPTFRGRSLAAYWAGQPTPIASRPVFATTGAKDWELPPRYPIGKGAMQSLTTDSLHYILLGDGSEELYNIRTDPEELHNVSADPLYHDVLTGLRELIQSAAGKQ